MDALDDAKTFYRQGLIRDAETACERVLSMRGDHAESLELLAQIHQGSGRSESAVGLLCQAIRLHPRDAALHRRLADGFIALKRFDDAAAVLRSALEFDPESTRAHNNLGQVLMHSGRIEAAIESYRIALRLDPRYAIAHHNLGLALYAAGEDDASAQSFERAVDAAPTLVEAWCGRATVLIRQGRFPAAFACLETALHLRPADVTALTQKAFVLLSLERPVETLSCIDEVMRTVESSAEAHNIRAGALRKLGRRPQALRSLERAIALEPDHFDACCNRAMVLHEMGDTVGAVSAYRAVIKSHPDDIQARTRLLSRLIPAVPLSEKDVVLARCEFEAELLAHEAWVAARDLSEQGALTAAEQQFFYLSYQEEPNRPLLERYRSISAARLAHFPRLAPPPAQFRVPRRSANRLKVGFVSAHVYDHSVFNAILRGWLQGLDRASFEVSLFNVGSKRDEHTVVGEESVDHVDSGGRPVAEWARAIFSRDLDALIYPEVGMHALTLSLASLRLAPRQFAAWGHPETSGLPAIDTYLSAELFEPPNADEHYTERLVRLPNLGVNCRPYTVPHTPMDLEELGLTRRGPLFVCPGVPFKYRPRDDRVLIEIAQRLGVCTFVFFRHEIGELSDVLYARLAAAFRNARLDPARYLHFVPWLPRPTFFNLLREADVYLDTIGFSGFNTMMQAIECRLPCVTVDGRFMRGRLGSGILKRLGLSELIARDQDQYIDIAARLATDSNYRSAIRTAMGHAERRAFHDTGAVEALAGLLLRGAEAAHEPPQSVDCLGRP